MQKDRFEHLCLAAEAGRDAFVRHPSSKEGGMLTCCAMKSGHLVVKTPRSADPLLGF